MSHWSFCQDDPRASRCCRSLLPILKGELDLWLKSKPAMVGRAEPISAGIRTEKQVSDRPAATTTVWRNPPTVSAIRRGSNGDCEDLGP